MLAWLTKALFSAAAFVCIIAGTVYVIDWMM